MFNKKPKVVFGLLGRNLKDNSDILEMFNGIAGQFNASSLSKIFINLNYDVPKGTELHSAAFENRDAAENLYQKIKALQEDDKILCQVYPPITVRIDIKPIPVSSDPTLNVDERILKLMEFHKKIRSTANTLDGRVSKGGGFSTAKRLNFNTQADADAFKTEAKNIVSDRRAWLNSATIDGEKIEL